MARWDENFNKAFTGAYETSAQNAFKKWQAEQESNPQAIAAKYLPLAVMSGNTELANRLSIMAKGGVPPMPSNSGVGGQVTPDPYGIGSAAEITPNMIGAVGQGGMGTKITPSGKLSFSTSGGGMGDLQKANLDVAKQGAVEQIKKQQYIKQSALTSQYNLNLSAESLADYAKLLAKSWAEGGAGNLMKSLQTKAAMKGVPIGNADKYQTSGALAGKLVEIVSKTFPMLTQQIGKEGSVRLIESVFQKLGSSYPNAATPPSLAPEQIRQSLLSMYRINRAMANLNLNDFKLDSKSGQQAFVDRVAKEVNNIELSPEEQKTFDMLDQKVNAPIYAFLELKRRREARKKK